MEVVEAMTGDMTVDMGEVVMIEAAHTHHAEATEVAIGVEEGVTLLTKAGACWGLLMVSVWLMCRQGPHSRSSDCSRAVFSFKIQDQCVQHGAREG